MCENILFGGPVRIVASSTGSGGNRTMHMLLVEGGLVMTAEAQPAQIVAVGEEIAAVSAVWLMTGQAVTVLDWRVRDLSRAGGLMAGGTEFVPGGNQRESFFSRGRMLG